MLKDGRRLCDCCNEEIPQGSKYRRAHIVPEQALILDAAASADPDISVTFTTNTDGSRSMDVCSECTVSIGHIPTKEEMN